MKYSSISHLSNQPSRIVQGTIPLTSKNEDASFRLLDAAIEAGVNTFDTAHGYGGGDQERVFGRWLKARNCRDNVIILGKGAHHNSDRRRVTPYDIESDLHDSLARMQVDHVDLYLMHRDDDTLPVDEIVDALNRLKNEGLMQAFGGSNWHHTRIQQANDYALANGLQPFSASSPNFSLAEQYREPWLNCVTISGDSNAAARDYYRENQFPVFAWSSIGGGFFSGRMDRDKLDWDDYFMKLAVDCYAGETNLIRLDRVREIAKRKDCSVPQVAMSWVLGSGLNLFALTGGTTPEEITETAKAIDITLTPAEHAYLNLERDTSE
ncbi:MAG: aldo/keto reductase [Chthonomonadales bacterium]